jgi:hypothetical protein
VRRFKLGTEKEIDYDDPTLLAELKTGLEAIINRTIDTYEAGEKLGKNAGFYRQALSHMGIEYFVKNGDIMITDMDVHVRGLKHFKEVGTLMQQLKSHQGTEQELALIKQKISILDQQYAESIKATDINVETERKAKSVEIDQKLEDFNNTEKLELINVPPLKYTLDELKGSAQTEDRGDYVLCLDKPLGSGQMGVVVAGYNKQTGQMLSFKSKI